MIELTNTITMEQFVQSDDALGMMMMICYCCALTYNQCNVLLIPNHSSSTQRISRPIQTNRNEIIVIRF